jgi:hypothetical protein
LNASSAKNPMKQQISKSIMELAVINCFQSCLIRNVTNIEHNGSTGFFIMKIFDRELIQKSNDTTSFIVLYLIELAVRNAVISFINNILFLYYRNLTVSKDNR